MALHPQPVILAAKPEIFAAGPGKGGADLDV